MTEAAGEFFDFLGKQSFVVDPRGQGFGLREHEFLDGYANKFFILSGSEGIFISPREIPTALRNYFEGIDIETAASENTFALPPDTQNGSLAERLGTSQEFLRVLSQRSDKFIVPYMVTRGVEDLASHVAVNTLISADTCDSLADKAAFQERLSLAADEIARETGYDIAISSIPFIAGDRAHAAAAYLDLSGQGERDVVVVRPKSASALGIFVVRAAQGIQKLQEVLGSHFSDEDLVLLEEYVEHNYSPSMQGERLPGSTYNRLYNGQQFISVKDGRIEYDASQIPFNHATDSVVSGRDMGRLHDVHQALGEVFFERPDVVGIAGFDALLHAGPDGTVSTLKMTELNTHLPSSLAVYAAVNKVFPSGFSGIAYNCNIPLRLNESVTDFLNRNAAHLVSSQGRYGVFPLNASFPDKVDVVFFARDTEHLAQMRGATT